MYVILLFLAECGIWSHSTFPVGIATTKQTKQLKLHMSRCWSTFKGVSPMESFQYSHSIWTFEFLKYLSKINDGIVGKWPIKKLETLELADCWATQHLLRATPFNVGQQLLMCHLSRSVRFVVTTPIGKVEWLHFPRSARKSRMIYP